MKNFLLILLVATSFAGHAQSIIGTWQLVKESNCMDEKLTAASSSEADMVSELKSQSKPAPQIVTFKEKMTGEETTRILNKRKGTNAKTFMYKFDSEYLMILDKKSKTITDSFIVEKFSSDSLIVSNASRPCETKILVKIR